MMNQNVEEVTQKLFSRLPGDQNPLALSDFQQYDFPLFLIDEIKNIVSAKFKNSVTPPETQWADTENEQVQKNWVNYLDSLKENLQIPPENADSIVKVAVENLLNLAVNPFKSIPAKLFRENEELSADEIRRQTGTIRVHSHLVTALVRYMQKREIDTISEEKAEEILRKIDHKLTEKFNALHWAHYIRPLFDLAGPNLDTELVRQFFEVREQHRFAKKFDEMAGNVNESNFIVALSSSDTLNYSGYEEDQPSLFTPGKDEEETEIDDSDQPKTIEKEPEQEEIIEEPVASDETQEMDRVPWDEETGTDDVKYEEDIDVEDEEDQEPGAFVKSSLPADEEVDEPEDELEPDNQNLSEEFERKTGETSDKKEKKTSGEENEHEITKKENEPDPDKISISEEYSFRGTNITDDDDEDSESSLYSRFIFDEENAEDDEKPEESLSTIYDEMELVREDDTEEKTSVLSLFEGKEIEHSEEDEDEIEEDVEDTDFEDKPDDEKTYKTESDTEEEIEDFDSEPDEVAEKGIYSKEIDDTTDDEDTLSRYFTEETEDEDDEEDSEVPMWKSFLEREEFEEEETEEFQKPEQQESVKTDADSETEDEPVDEDGFIDEPIIDLTKEEQSQDDKIQPVESWLSDDRDRFIGSIFSGSDMAYESALSEIIDFEDWKNASRYIEKEIFSRNMVDIYDEDAIDFTDRLHNYFKEFKS